MRQELRDKRKGIKKREREERNEKFETTETEREALKEEK